MKRRVVITGMGAVTPTGNSVKEFWESVRAGRCGVSPITRFDASGYKCGLAAEVKNFDPKERMDAKSARRMGLFSQYAVAAAGEALRDSGINMEKEDPYRVGVIVGSGIGSLHRVEMEYSAILEKGPGKVHPLMVPIMIANMASGNIAIQFGCKGKCTSVVTACATGTHSIGDAYRAIQWGDADVMLAGGTESAVCPTAIAGFSALTALTDSTDPARASIPFDKERKGFVLGEGAGVVVLEELEHAKRRDAHILAEVAGYGATCDAYHITSPAPDGSGSAKAMTLAMKEAGIGPEELDYINAHGTGTRYNDLFETRAIKLALGERAYRIPVNSTKSMVGHLLGAAGAVELITCVKEIQEGFIHQTIGTVSTDEECELDYVIGKPVEKNIDYAMSNSLGFGGHNASLLIRSYGRE